MNKKLKRWMMLLLCITYLSVGLLGGTGLLSVRGQDEGPVLGRKPKPKPQPEPEPTKGKPKSNRRGKRTGSGDAAGSPVPKGKNMEFYVVKGSELLDKGDYELAALYFEEADKRRKDRGVTPEMIDLLERQSRVANLHMEAAGLEEGNAERALSIYEEILKLRPNDQRAKEQLPILYNKIADSALSNKSYDKAVELYAQLSALSPENEEIKKKLVDSLLGRGAEEMKAGKEESAQTTYRRVLQLDPKNKQAQEALQVFDLRSLLKVAEERLTSGNYEEAVAKFKELLSLDPNNEQAKKGLQLAQGNYQKQKAEQLYIARNYTEAEREYREARNVLPDDEQIRNRLSELTLRLGKPLPPRGKMVWRGKIAGPLKVMIKGKELSYPEGEAVRDGGTLTDGLPDIAYLVKRIRKLTGDAAVRISDQPTPANGYVTVVALNPKQTVSAEVSFELEWELKRQGRLVWNGQVSGRSLLRVQGPFVDIEQLSGEPAKDVKFQTDGLPHQDALLKLRKVSGKPEIRLKELPSQANLYTAIISIENPSETGSEPLSFELEWQLK